MTTFRKSIYGSIMLGAALSAGNLSAAWQAGLQTITLSSGSSLNKTSFSAATTNVVMSPVMAGTTSGWGASTTYVYWGQIHLDGSTYNFAESIDDAVYLKIDGTVLLDNASWSATTVGSITRDAGWYDFELRLYNGSGGAGPSNQDSWGTTAYGFGFNTSGYTGKVGSNYTFPIDPGDRTLFRYDDGLGFDDNLTIDGFPQQFASGQVVPSYGSHSGNAAGAEISCSAPAAWTNAAETIAAMCTGWKLYDSENQHLLSGVGSSYAYTHPDPADFRQLVWQWALAYKVTASATAGGSVSKSEEWVDEGAQFTATATPAAGNSFYRWRDGNGNTVSRNASISVKIDEPIALTAEFAGVVYVDATNGDDVNGDGSAEHPYATVEKGVYSAHGGDTVILADGNYPVDGNWLYVTNAITLKSVNGPSATSIYSTRPNSKRHIMWMDNEGAKLDGIKIKDGYWSQYSDGKHTGLHYPGGLWLENGIVTNCVFTNNKGGNSVAGALHMKGGYVVDSVFYGNKAVQDSNVTQGQGGALNIVGGLVEHCVISNNYAENQGGGVYVNGGTLRHSLVTGNKVSQATRSAAGICLVKGNVEFCEITGNGSGSKLAGTGAGVYMTGGTLRSCFISRNKADANGAGVYQSGGTMEFCTIAGNESTNGGNGGLRLNGSTAVCRNNVIFANGDHGTVATANVKYENGTYEYNSSDSEIVANAHNVGNPNFVDASTGNYTLAAGSPAIDSALSGENDPIADFAGNIRPKDGDGDGTAVIDMGCFEAMAATEGELRCAFSVAGTIGMDSCESTFTASVGGEGSDGTLTYKWDIDNDGCYDVVGTDKQSFTTNITAHGLYDVKLVVETSGASVEFTMPGAVRVGASTLYVNASNEAGARWPYSTPETAAVDLYAAFDTMVREDGVTNTLYISEGEYPLSGKWLDLSTPIRLIGVGDREKCVLKAAYSVSNNRRVLNVAHSAAWVEGLTLSNGRIQGYDFSAEQGGAAGVHISAGIVTNCVIRDCHGSVECTGGVLVKGGTLVDCVIRGCHADQGGSGWAKGYGGGVRVNSGLVENCVITNNYLDKYNAGEDISCGGGLYLSGADAVVRNCRIADNYCVNAGYGAYRGTQVRVNDGLLENCEIGYMRRNGFSGSPVYQSSGTIRNCLVAGAKSKAAIQGVEIVGGLFCNNTVVTNGFNVTVDSPVAAKITGGGITNCIFAANVSDAITIDGGAIGHSRFADSTGTGNISDDPLFHKPAKGDWTLNTNSPCVNTGDFTALGERAAVRAMLDLAGNRRFVRSNIDMGCYENQSEGTTLILR